MSERVGSIILTMSSLSMALFFSDDRFFNPSSSPVRSLQVMAIMASSGPSRTLLLRCSLLFSFFLFVILQGVVPSAAAQSHGHRSLNHRNTAGTSNIDDAQALVNEALKGIAAANKLRVENPRRDKSGYRQGAFESSATVQRLDSSFEARSNASSIDYVIPESVITAAKSVAESCSHTKGATIDGVAKAAKLKAQYWPKRSDADTASHSARDSSSLETRASAFWMENMSMNGRSPLAPSGYVVSLSTETLSRRN